MSGVVFNVTVYVTCACAAMVTASRTRTLRYFICVLLISHWLGVPLSTLVVYEKSLLGVGGPGTKTSVIVAVWPGANGPILIGAPMEIGRASCRESV